ncbi:hypothetical protein BDZ45DRAFT_679143, partial [Acephala macrosclerotiorum]
MNSSAILILAPPVILLGAALNPNKVPILCVWTLLLYIITWALERNNNVERRT